MLVGNFEKNHQRGTKILFCGCDLKCFSPLTGTNSKATHCILSYLIHLNTLKGVAKAPAVDLLSLSTLRGTKTMLLTPKR